jgi:hypothetical protein
MSIEGQKSTAEGGSQRGVHSALSSGGEVHSAPPSTGSESAIEEALRLAAQAGQWDVVKLLSKELEIRRLAAMPNVIPIDRRSGRE